MQKETEFRETTRPLRIPPEFRLYNARTWHRGGRKFELSAGPRF